MNRMAFAAGFAFALGLGGVTTAQAGLLDFIFGWRDRTDIPRAAPAPQHPTVTISARPRAKRVAVKTRSAPAPAPKPKIVRLAVPPLSPKDQLARTIDPVKNPRWYLEDKTLRKGDILVLADRVVVFTGGKLGSPKSYVSLGRSKLLTTKERARIASMTGRGAEPSAVANATTETPRRFRAAFRLRAAARG